VLARSREAGARVTIIDQPEGASSPDGSVSSKQVADVILPGDELARIWKPEYLERLAATYWRFLRRVSLGVLRVIYTPAAREIVVLGRPLVLLRFHAPEYETAGDRASVTWPIDKGLLVAPAGRGTGFLRISVERREDPPGPEETVRVSSEVSNFYPMLAGWGWFSKIGRYVYRYTQLAIHVVVTHAFLRSLARLDLVPSQVGALRDSSQLPPADPEGAAAGRESQPA
jgi:hypothetical protein